MSTDQNPSNAFGMRGTGTIEEKDGVRYVKEVRFDSVSIVSDPEDIARIQDASTVPVSMGYQTVPEDSPRRGKTPRGLMPMIGHIDDPMFPRPPGARGDNLPFVILDDFAFLPTEALNEALEKKAEQLGLKADRAYCVIFTSDNQMIDCSEALTQEKIESLGISPEVLYNTEPEYSAAAEHLKFEFHIARRSGKASGLAWHHHGFLYHMMPEFPLGTNTHLFQKRSFDYELIGGM